MVGAYRRHIRRRHHQHTRRAGVQVRTCETHQHTTTRVLWKEFAAPSRKISAGMFERTSTLDMMPVWAEFDRAHVHTGHGTAVCTAYCKHFVSPYLACAIRIASHCANTISPNDGKQSSSGAKRSSIWQLRIRTTRCRCC
jgi:hypothetical protein